MYLYLYFCEQIFVENTGCLTKWIFTPSACIHSKCENIQFSKKKILRCKPLKISLHLHHRRSIALAAGGCTTNRAVPIYFENLQILLFHMVRCVTANHSVSNIAEVILWVEPSGGTVSKALS